MKPLAILAVGALFAGCVGHYDLKGYDVGASAGKNIYNDYTLGVANNAYWTAGVNTSFHFAK